MTGQRTGVTTTEGVYIDGQRIMAGDGTGYRSARAVLTSLAKDKARAMGVDIIKTSHNGNGAR